MKVSSNDKICQKHFRMFQDDLKLSGKSYWTSDHSGSISVNDYLGFIESNENIQFYRITNIISKCDTLHKLIRENKEWKDTKFENRDIIELVPISHKIYFWNEWALQIGYTLGKNKKVFTPRGIQYVKKAVSLPT